MAEPEGALPVADGVGERGGAGPVEVGVERGEQGSHGCGDPWRSNPGIDIAHDLFCADSRAVVTVLRSDKTTLGRRELSLLLCSTLMRAANLEWYEQGDVWHRVIQERPLPTDISTAKVAAMADDAHCSGQAGSQSSPARIRPW